MIVSAHSLKVAAIRDSRQRRNTAAVFARVDSLGGGRVAAAGVSTHVRLAGVFTAGSGLLGPASIASSLSESLLCQTRAPLQTASSKHVLATEHFQRGRKLNPPLRYAWLNGISSLRAETPVLRGGRQAGRHPLKQPIRCLQGN